MFAKIKKNLISLGVECGPYIIFYSVYSTYTHIMGRSDGWLFQVFSGSAFNKKGHDQQNRPKKPAKPQQRVTKQIKYVRDNKIRNTSVNGWHTPVPGVWWMVKHGEWDVKSAFKMYYKVNKLIKYWGRAHLFPNKTIGNSFKRKRDILRLRLRAPLGLSH